MSTTTAIDITTTTTTTTTNSQFPASSPSAPPAPSALSTLLSTQTSSNHLTPTEALPLEILHNLQHQHSWTSLRLHHHHHHANASWCNTSKPSPQTHTPASPSLLKAEAEAEEANAKADAETAALKPSISHLDLTVPSTSTSTQPPPAGPSNPLTLLSGIPPQPLYTHPDLQLQLLKAGLGAADQEAEREWVVPTTLARKWSLSELCRVFDALPERRVRVIRRQGREGLVATRGAEFTSASADPSPSASASPSPALGQAEGSREAKKGERRSSARGEGEGEVSHQDAKRLLLAMRAHEGKGGDGTVVYYIVQEGEVKPRQN